jgi:hypothetical protein
VTEQIGGPRVFAVAWHVDYWNYLGWVDELSDPAYTARQERIAAALGSGMYTPEVVVNMFEVGYGDATSLAGMTEVLDYFLGIEVATSVTVWLDSPPDASPLVVNYMSDAAPAGSELTVILVEGGLSNDVTSGENAGDTLDHENAVRGFATVTEGLESGQVEIDAPPDLVPETARLVAFVQDSETLEHLGATGIRLVE